MKAFTEEESLKFMGQVFLAMMVELGPGQKVAVKKESMARAAEMLAAGHTPLRSGLLPNGDVWTMVYTRDI